MARLELNLVRKLLISRKTCAFRENYIFPQILCFVFSLSVGFARSDVFDEGEYSAEQERYLILNIPAIQHS